MFLSYFDFDNINLYEKIKYNIKFILDSNYYYELFNDIDNIILKKENNFYGIKFKEISQKETNRTSGNIDNKDNTYDNPYSNSFYDQTTRSINLDSSSIPKEEIGFDLNITATKYQIVKIIGIIGEYKNTAEFIIELSNGYYVSGGTDNILKIYGKDFKKLKEIEDIKEWIYSCFERKKNSFDNNDYDIELIVCCNELLYKICLSFKEEIIKCKSIKYTMKDLTFKSCILIKENNSVFIGYNSCYLENFFISQTSKIKNNSIVSGKTYFDSIKINENLIAMTSNKVHDYGEDKLIFYNTDKKTISREIEGYSFTSGINGLALIPREEVKCKNKILLCAYKKYIDGQKNGIYLANLQLEDKQLVNNHFYDTENFEVFCFCPILIINPEKYEEKGKEKKQ